MKGTQRASHPSSGQGPQPQGLRPLLFSVRSRPACADRRHGHPGLATTSSQLSHGCIRTRRAPMSERLARSAGLIGLATLASRVLGLVRDVVQGVFFGTSAAADAFVRRDAHAEAPARSVRRRRDERRVRSDVHAYLTKDGTRGGVASRIAGHQRAARRHGHRGHCRDRLRRAARHAFYASEYADTPGKLGLTIRSTRVNMPFLLLDRGGGGADGHAEFAAQVPDPRPRRRRTYNVVFILCMVMLVPVFTADGHRAGHGALGRHAAGRRRADR